VAALKHRCEVPVPVPCHLLRLLFVLDFLPVLVPAVVVLLAPALVAPTVGLHSDCVDFAAFAILSKHLLVLGLLALLPLSRPTLCVVARCS